MADDKYTVTVYVAAPGTPLINEAPGTTSGPGHMFYTTSNGHDKPQSFGFAPVQHGSMDLATSLLTTTKIIKIPSTRERWKSARVNTTS